MKTLKAILQAAFCLAPVLLLVSCNPLVKNTESASLLIIESIQGMNMKEELVDYLQSDVLFQDPETFMETIYADSAVVTFRVEPLDPALPTSQQTPYYNVQVTRYVVTFSKPNGDNIEGRDVPYSFEGSMSALVTVGDTRDVAFIIVREVAKMEPPLVQLVDASDVLEAIAKIEFYGKDLAGKSVKATGYLTVFFANYANESTSTPAAAGPRSQGRHK